MAGFSVPVGLLKGALNDADGRLSFSMEGGMDAQTLRKSCMSPDLIFDVGMNNGADTEFYLRKGYRVVAIEANPALCEKVIGANSEAIASGRLRVLNVGVANEAATLNFYVNHISDDWSSFDPGYGKRQDKYEVIQVQCQTFSSILDKIGEIPYYLKIDIEGYDDLCLDALVGRADLPKYISVESGVRDFPSRMHSLGYNRFKLISQVWHNFLPLPHPAREGRYVNQAMTGLHSGPFGDETYGPWISGSEVSAEHERYEAKDFDNSLHKTLGCPKEIWEVSWWDYHAALGD